MFTISFIALLKQLSLAIVLGFALGVEREIARKSAGIRTHILVSLGAALFSIISTSIIGPNVDPTRIAAQIVVGIGFLGGGMIIFHGRDKKRDGPLAVPFLPVDLS